MLLALPVLAIWWAALVGVTVDGAGPGVAEALPVADLAVEAAATVALAIGLAAVARRGIGSGVGSVVAGPGLLVVMTVLYLLPARWALFVRPQDPRWEAAHERWAALLALALVGLVWAGREPARRTGRRLVRAGRPEAAPPRARPPVTLTRRFGHRSR